MYQALQSIKELAQRVSDPYDLVNAYWYRKGTLPLFVETEPVRQFEVQSRVRNTQLGGDGVPLTVEGGGSGESPC